MVGGGHRFEPHWMEEGVTGHTGKQRVVLLIEKPMHHTPSKKILPVKKSCVADLHMFTHIALHPDSCNHLHFLMCTWLSSNSPKSLSRVARTSIGPTIHAKTTFVMTAFNSRENLFTGNSFRNTLEF